MNRTHLVFVLLSTSILNPQSFLAAQALDPPYLKEIPSVERVLKEIQGKDPDETAAKQMGTFLQFKSLIETMSGRRRYQNKLTPDENRLISEYHTAYFQVTQRKPEYTKMPALKGFDIDPRWRSELFTRYFSPEFTAQYAAVDAMFERRHKEFLQGEIEQHKRALAEKAEYERKASGNDASTAKMRKCIEAGRDETKCAMEALGWLTSRGPSLRDCSRRRCPASS